jgi:hypothetical protein
MREGWRLERRDERRGLPPTLQKQCGVRVGVPTTLPSPAKWLICVTLEIERGGGRVRRDSSRLAAN